MAGRSKADHLRTGRQGERAAEDFLRAAGLEIVERNWRPGGPENLEIDLICRAASRARGQREKTLVFVEVKARASDRRGHPSLAVTPAKCAKLRRAASLYLSIYDAWDAPCRFDVVSVLGTGEDIVVEHVENAF